MYLYETIKEVLGSRAPKRIEDHESRYTRAAVLIPLFSENGEHRILFTKRSRQVKTHKGQISLPGGVVEETDQSPEETALREAYEEIGLLKDDVDILGQADDTTTVVSSFIVHPFVGVMPYPYDFRVNHREVDVLIEARLAELLDPKNYQSQTPDSEGRLHPWGYFQYREHRITGITALILDQFLDLLFRPQGSGASRAETGAV